MHPLVKRVFAIFAKNSDTVCVCVCVCVCVWSMASVSGWCTDVWVCKFIPCVAVAFLFTQLSTQYSSTSCDYKMNSISDITLTSRQVKSIVHWSNDNEVRCSI